MPGTPVLGWGEPWVMTRPRKCPRMVSTTASQSTGAVKPGPTAMTVGAISRVVPKLRLARIASTTAAGFSSSSILAWGSTTTATSPASVIASASAGVRAKRARMPSTSTSPRRMASQKLIVRRMHVGTAISAMTTDTPARTKRAATPVAISPAPRTYTSIPGAPPCATV